MSESTPISGRSTPNHQPSGFMYPVERRARCAADKAPPPQARQEAEAWSNDELPGYRLRRHGVQTLSDAELLSILIGSGTRTQSALEVARELLRTCGDLHRLLSRDISELTAVHGIAGRKAMRLIAALECSRRLHAAPFLSRTVIRSPDDLATYYIPLLRGAVRETFRVLLLNAANQVFREAVVTEGSLNSATVHPREVFRTAITEAAASVILLHNHPSGNTEPSPEDYRVTERLCSVGKIIDIKVLDHVIIAGESFMSFSQRGLL